MRVLQQPVFKSRSAVTYWYSTRVPGNMYILTKDTYNIIKYTINNCLRLNVSRKLRVNFSYVSNTWDLKLSWWYSDYNLLACDTVWLGRLAQTCRRNKTPLFSKLKMEKTCWSETSYEITERFIQSDHFSSLKYKWTDRECEGKNLAFHSVYWIHSHISSKIVSWIPIK